MTFLWVFSKCYLDPSWSDWRRKEKVCLPLFQVGSDLGAQVELHFPLVGSSLRIHRMITLILHGHPLFQNRQMDPVHPVNIERNKAKPKTWIPECTQYRDSSNARFLGKLYITNVLELKIILKTFSDKKKVKSAHKQPL